MGIDTHRRIEMRDSIRDLSAPLGEKLRPCLSMQAASAAIKKLPEDRASIVKR